MVHTHVLTVAGALVTKRYSSWARGEHRREWEALRRVHRHAPQLAPRPVEQHLDADPPWITMSRVPGEPLPDRPTPVQLTALAHAVGTLWTVPLDDLSASDGWIDDLACVRRLTDGPRPDAGILAQAFEAAVAWWDGPDPALLRTRPAATVLGHRDPNLANYLWGSHGAFRRRPAPAARGPAAAGDVLAAPAPAGRSECHAQPGRYGGAPGRASTGPARRRPDRPAARASPLKQSARSEPGR